MRVSVHVGDCLGRQSAFRCDEAASAGTVRSGDSGLPETIPGSRECSRNRALLLVDPGLLRACRGTAQTVQGSRRVQRDHVWRVPAGQTW